MFHVYIVIGILSLFVLYVCSLMVIFIYKTQCSNNKEENTVRPQILLTTIIHYICTVLGVCVQFITFTYLQDHVRIGTYIKSTLLLISFISLYSFFLFQLYYTYNSTALKVSKSVYCVHGTILTTICIIWSFGLILDKVNEMFYCWVILWHIGIFHIILVFVKKLVSLILSQRISYLGVEDIDRSSINDRQLRLIFVATKMCVISQTIVCIGIVYFTQEFVFGSIDHDKSSVYGLIRLFIAIMLMATDNLIVFLTFGMNRDWYICICRICHTQHQKIYEKLVVKKMRKEREMVAPSTPVTTPSPVSDEHAVRGIETEELRE